MGRFSGGRSFGSSVGGHHFFNFLQAGGFTGEFGEVVEFGSSYLAHFEDFNAVHAGRVHRENAFHAYAERDFAYGERFADATSSAGDNHAVKGLESFVVAFRENTAKAVARGALTRACGAYIAVKQCEILIKSAVFYFLFNFVDIHKTYFLRIVFFFWTFFDF